MTHETTRRDVLRTGTAAVAAMGVTSTAGCTEAVLGGDSGGSEGSVAVGSKKFAEQEILGTLALEAIDRNTDVSTTDETSLGGTVTNFEALKNDQIDLYWEYTGTVWATLPPKHDEVITDPQEIYEKAKSEFESEHGITMLDRAPFNNTYVLTANSEWVSETGVSSLTGFADHVNSGNTDFTVVMNAEFQDRDDGWPGLTDHYGFSDTASELNVKNVDSGLTYQVVGQGDAAVGMGFNTNPKIIKFDLEVLEDDDGFFPVYNPAPLVTQEALDDNGAIAEPLNAVAGALTTDKIRELNRRVSIDGEDVSTVADDFLSNENVT